MACDDYSSFPGGRARALGRLGAGGHGDPRPDRLTPACPSGATGATTGTERCYWDDGLRLPGRRRRRQGLALRASLRPGEPSRGTRPSRARALRLFHDGTCVRSVSDGDRRATSASYEIDAHRIWTSRWASEREVVIDGRISATAWLDPATRARRARLEPDRARARSGTAGPASNGVLLKLADGEEDFGTSGPYFPSELVSAGQRFARGSSSASPRARRLSERVQMPDISRRRALAYAGRRLRRPAGRREGALRAGGARAVRAAAGERPRDRGRACAGAEADGARRRRGPVPGPLPPEGRKPGRRRDPPRGRRDAEGGARARQPRRARRGRAAGRRPRARRARAAGAGLGAGDAGRGRRLAST